MIVFKIIGIIVVAMVCSLGAALILNKIFGASDFFCGMAGGLILSSILRIAKNEVDANIP